MFGQADTAISMKAKISRALSRTQKGMVLRTLHDKRTRRKKGKRKGKKIENILGCGR